MATSTPNYGLYKYEGSDAPDLTKLSTSMDKIDTELKENATNIGLLRRQIVVMVSADGGNFRNVLERILPTLTVNEKLTIVIKGGAYGSDALAEGLKTSDTYATFMVQSYTGTVSHIKCNNGNWITTAL